MAEIERYAFAIIRGAVKAIPIAGGIVEEVLRVLDEERTAAEAAATGVLAARSPAAGARLTGDVQADVERLAGEALRALPELERDDLQRWAAAIAVEPDRARRREQVWALSSRLSTGLLAASDLGARVTAIGAPRADERSVVTTMAPGVVVGGRYRLLERLGKGGFGTVWRARHEDLGQDVALKLLNPDIAGDELTRQRFLREVRATTSFVHKYAVQLREFGRDPALDGVLYFTMDLVEGRTLREVLQAEGRLAPWRAARALSQTLEVLEEAHAVGIVHRDLKPENLVLALGRAGDEEVRVLDFGIAKAVAAARDAAPLTADGCTIGTLYYMSPEQADGAQVDARSDLYAAGVVLFEAIAGRLPIEPRAGAEGSVTAFIMALATQVPPDLRRLVPDVPAALAEVVSRALAKSPEARFPSARAFRAALAPFVDPPQAHAWRAGGSMVPARGTAPSGPAAAPLDPGAFPTGAELVPAAIASAGFFPTGEHAPAAAASAGSLPTGAGAGPPSLPRAALPGSAGQPRSSSSRLTAPPTSAPATIRCTVVDGPLTGRVVEATGHETVLLGRGCRGGLRITGDGSISRNHCLLELSGTVAHLRDLGSRNGTFVNGARVREAAVGAGDQVRLGRTVLRVELLGGAPPSPAALRCARCAADVPAAEAAWSVVATDASSPVCARCRSAAGAGAPEVFEGYKVERKLAEGGMGAVYLATHKASGAAVAIKTLRPEISHHPEAIPRFLRETMSHAQLEHPGAVKFLGSGFSRGLFYFVMEFVAGPSLDQIVAERGPLAVSDAVLVTTQLLDLLEHAHAKKLVHRDIKPSNVLLARTPPGPVARLADFGLMRRFESSGFSLMSRTGQRRGTMSYMPPEQVEDSKRVGPAADLYAVAGTLFFMLTGTTPLEFSPAVDPILTILEGEPRPLRALCPAAGPRLEAVVARCLAKAPKERFGAATALRTALLAAAPRG